MLNLPVPKLKAWLLTTTLSMANGARLASAVQLAERLVDAKLYRVSDLRKISLAELQGLHGMGKSSVARIRQIMDAKKIKFLIS